MQAEQGKRVTISFICSQQDGSLYDFTDKNTLRFTIGTGHVLPSLETGVVGMKAGEHRTIRLPAREMEQFPLAFESAYSHPRASSNSRIPNGYEFAPGADGDISAPSQPKSRRIQPPLAPETILLFHVKMLAVES